MYVLILPMPQTLGHSASASGYPDYLLENLHYCKPFSEVPSLARLLLNEHQPSFLSTNEYTAPPYVVSTSICVHFEI